MTGNFRPVFVVGCQRSGSTLLGSMLGAHSQIICVPEGQFIVDLMPNVDGAGNVDPANIIDRIANHWRFRVWEFDLGSDRPRPGEIEPTYRASIEWLIRRYAAANDRKEARIWVDHQPGNVRYLWRLFQHFPDAKAIHIIRDGRAVAASIMPLDWGPNEIYNAARFWKLNVALGYAAGGFLGLGQLLHLRYEDLVRDSKTTMQRVAEFVGVEFDPGMLTTAGLKLPRFTKEQHQLIGRVPAPERIDAWQQELTNRQIEIFERYSGDLLRQHGYEHLTIPTRLSLKWTEKAEFILRDQIKKGIRGVQFWSRRRPYSR